jgi:predicted nucleic-acid-binding protein
MTFVDTNYFTKQAIALFQRAESGSVKLMTLSHILFELAWTLSRRYKVSKMGVIERLEAIMAIPNLFISDREIINEALTRARLTNSDFADSYLIAAAERAGADNIATFNAKHFTRLGAVIYEPA